MPSFTWKGGQLPEQVPHPPLHCACLHHQQQLLGRGLGNFHKVPSLCLDAADALCTLLIRGCLPRASTFWRFTNSLPECTHAAVQKLDIRSAELVFVWQQHAIFLWKPEGPVFFIPVLLQALAMSI